MDFYDIVRQVLALLQRDGRTSYRALKRQFSLDDEAVGDLKEELLYAHPVIDDDGRGLVWTAGPATSEPGAQRGADAESRFHAILPVLTGLLRNEERKTYRELKHIFSLDDALLEDIRETLTFKQLARDENGKGLVWTGDKQATGMIEPLDAISTDVPSKKPADTPEPIHGVPEAERRQLTVMFCDLADSTKLSQQLDPEDLREVIRAYQATAADVIQRYEGHMAQYLGDGLLIYFGWPRAHEDDAQRALHAGLGIVEAVTTNLNPHLEAKKGVQLTVRIGIHSGPVVVGEMGGGERHENLATGETVNIAARLEGLAAPNTVLISSVTARLVERAFALEELGPQTLKGVADPMNVFRVLDSMQVHMDDTASVGVPFLVGRDEEVGLLLRRWEQSKEGLGQVVLIRGEAGIGKSSLVTTARTHVARNGKTRIIFRCSPYHTNSALYPVISHLEQMLGFERDDSPEVRLDKLEQALKATELPLEESVPLLATLLSVPLEGRHPALTLPSQQQRQQTLDTLAAWLMEESEKQPVLAIWEDIHWADPSTLEMLGLILEQSPTVPMLHILTFRPEFDAPWPTRSHMTPITLNRLERPQVKALITHLAGGKALPAEVIEHIITKTDGVPLYVEELTKMLLTSDLLCEEADQYVLTGPLTTVAIPDTLQDSLMARLDQMNTGKEVAQIGAVLGREFTYEMIQAVASLDENTIQSGLEQLVQGELLYQRGRSPRSMYIFKHALIQDAAYATLLKRTRQQIHRRIAECLVERFPDIGTTQPELVAHHYTEAGCHEQAVTYWQQAGQQANERSAYAEAVGHLTKGLHVLAELPETSQRTQHDLDLHLSLGPALMATEGHHTDAVERVYTRARELCRQVGETPQLFAALGGLHRFYYVRGALHTAYELGEQFLALAERQADSALLLTGHWLLGCPLLWQGRVARAHEHLEQNIALFDPQQHRDLAFRYGLDPGSASLAFSAFTLWALGYPEQARQRSQKALIVAQKLEHPFSQTYVLLLVALFHWLNRDRQSTSRYIEACLSLAAEHGFPIWSIAGTWLRGAALAEQGQLDEGIDHLLRGMEGLRSTGTELLTPMILIALAAAHTEDGQAEASQIFLDDALDTIDKTTQHFWEAELYRLLGQCLLAKAATEDNPTQAETCFHQALSVARRQEAKSWELRAAISLARLWQSRGKRQDAYGLLAPVYGWFTEGFDTADLKDAKSLLDELEE